MRLRTKIGIFLLLALIGLSVVAGGYLCHLGRQDEAPKAAPVQHEKGTE